MSLQITLSTKMTQKRGELASFSGIDLLGNHHYKKRYRNKQGISQSLVSRLATIHIIGSVHISLYYSSKYGLLLMLPAVVGAAFLVVSFSSKEFDLLAQTVLTFNPNYVWSRFS